MRERSAGERRARSRLCRRRRRSDEGDERAGEVGEEAKAARLVGAANCFAGHGRSKHGVAGDAVCGAGAVVVGGAPDGDAKPAAGVLRKERVGAVLADASLPACRLLRGGLADRRLALLACALPRAIIALGHRQFRDHGRRCDTGLPVVVKAEAAD
jgi:hypothetical protein